MADVVICWAPENEATLRQVADAVARAGYSLWHGDAAAPGADAVTEQIAAAKAVIVIWSEAAAASEWVKAEANVARGLKKLIQVSADGRPPPIPFDRAGMISVLTWRGEEDHPAWRGIAAGLERLAGPPPERTALADPEPAVAAPVEAVPAAAPEPVLPPAPDDLTPAKGPNKAVIVLVVLLVLAALAAAAWYWMQQRQSPESGPAPSLELNMAGATPPAAAPDAATPPAAPETPAEVFDRRATIQGVDHAMVRSTPSGIGFDIARIEAGEVISTYEQSGDWWRVRTASGRTGYINMALIRLRDTAVPNQAAQAPPPAPPGQTTPPVRTTERRPPPRPPRGPRIRKENSEVMEAFCENAGRGTPQCRSFGRSRY
jgi:HAMP domain-containing protein